MKQKPKISIITVCYNAPNLRQTCDSVIEQTFQDFEWLVIDGGSDKKTLDIFEKYRDRIDFFVSEKDNGIYNAMNKGIAHANGEYLLFLNAGDFLYSKYALERFVDEGLDKDIIYANIQSYACGIAIMQPDVLDIKFWLKSTLPHQATLIRAELFKLYGPYNENYKIVSDYEKWVQWIYVNHCSYKHINFMSSVFDCTGASSSNNYDAERTDVITKYIDKSEIDAFSNSRKSLLQKIFSVNPWIVNKSYLDITIFGKHIRVKRKKH